MKRMAKSVEFTLFFVLSVLLVCAASWVFAPPKRYDDDVPPSAKSPVYSKYMGLSIEEFVERFDGAEAVDRSVEKL